VTAELGGAPGGVATHQVYLAQGLAAAGLDVSLLTTGAPAKTVDAPPALEPLPMYRMWSPRRKQDWIDPKYVRQVGATRLIRYALFTALQPRGALAASRRVLLGDLLWYARYIAGVRPDLIHVQHPLERQLYVGLLARLERWRLPVVVTVHSLFGEHPDEVVYGLMGPNLVRADRVIAVSQHVADQAVQLGVDVRRLRVIPSGVDVERFRPRDRLGSRRTLGLPADARVILFVGTLEARKQVDRLVAALPAVRKTVPNASLVVIGTGDHAGSGDQMPLLRRMVDELRLNEAVRFAGRVPEEDLADWYAAADVFALPSSSEGQGIAALEAMACGLPVVASAVGGLLTFVEDGRNGYLVPSGDVPALASRLIEILDDSRLRDRMGASACQIAKQRFSWPQTVADTIGVYNEVLTEPRLFTGPSIDVDQRAAV
jgi:D-inositol-3-phosphate glycosyltransferase